MKKKIHITFLVTIFDEKKLKLFSSYKDGGDLELIFLIKESNIFIFQKHFLIYTKVKVQRFV